MELSCDPGFLLAGRHLNPALAQALQGPDGLTSEAAGTMAGCDVRDQLGRLRVPARVAVGRRDSVPPNCPRTVHRGIGGSDLGVFRKSGHDCVYKEQDRYLPPVRDFLSQVGSRVLALA